MTIKPRNVPPASRITGSAFLASVFACLFLAPIAGAGETVPADAPRALTPELIWTRKSIADLQLSPDGSRLAMVVSEPLIGSETRRNIWICDLSTRRIRPFTTSVKSDGRPRWSPDGRTLAFLSARGGANQVYRIDLDGGEALALTEAGTAVDSFEWSPDGKRIVFETSAPGPTRMRRRRKRRTTPGSSAGKQGIPFSR